jgi:hypothetical protein
MQLYFLVALRVLYFLKKIEVFCDCLHWAASSKEAGWLPEIFSHLHHNHYHHYHHHHHYSLSKHFHVTECLSESHQHSHQTANQHY